MRLVRRAGPILTLTIILVLLLAFQIIESQERKDQEIPTTGPGQVVQVFFTEPFDPAAATLRGGPDSILAGAIESAQYSVDTAIYNLDLWSIRDALLAAHRRGVAVRVVVESNNAEAAEVLALMNSGIPVREDQRDSLMHHKFTVIDRFEVWTGSMNYSINGAYRNNNNMLRVRSGDVGANYTREFEEMFLEDRFGALSLPDTPFPITLIGEDRVEVYFSPDDGVASRLVELIDNSQSSVYALAFVFTSDPLAKAMRDAVERGVQVRIVVEKDQAGNMGSEVEDLLKGGADLRLDTNPNSMHHKVILIDETTVVTGSYNFSRSAEDFNDENVIIVHSPSLAQEYLVEFNSIIDGTEKPLFGRDD